MPWEEGEDEQTEFSHLERFKHHKKEIAYWKFVSHELAKLKGGEIENASQPNVNADQSKQ